MRRVRYVVEERVDDGDEPAVPGLVGVDRVVSTLDVTVVEPADDESALLLWLVGRYPDLGSDWRAADAARLTLARNLGRLLRSAPTDPSPHGGTPTDLVVRVVRGVARGESA